MMFLDSNISWVWKKLNSSSSSYINTPIGIRNLYNMFCVVSKSLYSNNLFRVERCGNAAVLLFIVISTIVPYTDHVMVLVENFHLYLLIM